MLVLGFLGPLVSTSICSFLGVATWVWHGKCIVGELRSGIYECVRTVRDRSKRKGRWLDTARCGLSYRRFEVAGLAVQRTCMCVGRFGAWTWSGRLSTGLCVLSVRCSAAYALLVVWFLMCEIRRLCALSISLCVVGLT